MSALKVSSPSKFNQAVRIRTLVLRSSVSPERGPKTLKLLMNKPAISFGDVEDADDGAFAQVVTLREEDVRDGRPVALKFVRFTNVNSLHVRVLRLCFLWEGGGRGHCVLTCDVD